MQFAYQFPERTERMVLVAPGGIGPEVTMLIRAVTLPGFHTAVGLVTLPGIRQLATGTLRTIARVDHPVLRDLDEIAAMVENLRDPRARRALRHLVRACVDVRGQIITMVDRAYLTQELPLCVIWGTDDPVIPSLHAETVRRIAQSARVELVERSGHFPHKDRPEVFARIVDDFISTTEPATYNRARWRAMLKSGTPASTVVPDTRVVTVA
jgi:pimeloyl-ACP methyl ester carboxylesterase